MAFTGKPGKFTSVQILGLMHNSDEVIYLKIKTRNTLWCLKCEDNRLVAIGGDPLENDIEDILITRGLLKIEILKEIDDSAVRKKGLEKLLVAKGQITEKQAQQAIYHLAESAFFEFIAETSGTFELIDSPCMRLYKLDRAFSTLISEANPDITFLKKFRSHFHDFDARLYWITPAKNPSLPKEMKLEEIKVLSRYRPSITIRSFWKSLKEPKLLVSEILVTLSERKILNPNPPGTAKIPNAKPFLRAMLARVVDQLLESQKLLGADNEIIEILNSINENLINLPTLTAATYKREELGDLSGLTGSLDGILDLNGVEELNLEQEIDKKDASPKKTTPKAGVRRQPVKKAKPKTRSEVTSEPIQRTMTSNQKRTDEALAIIEASKNLLGEGVSLEEKVDAKVRFRKFTSEVNMSFNKFTMTQQTLFEVLNVIPTATRKQIHKAFVKLINAINPKGIQFRKLDLETIEKAIFLRDELKKIYITLMDEKKKRAYIDSMREGRQLKEDNKLKAMNLFNEGMDRVRAGKYDEAREIFRRAVKFDPNSPVYYTVLEDIDKEEREGNAVKFFQAGILAFKQKNDFKRAIKLIRKAITLRPLDPTYQLKLAEIQAMSPEYRDDAFDSYIKALELDPGNQELRILIATFMKNRNRKQDAANMYHEVLRWNPEHSVVKKHLLELAKEGITPAKAEQTSKKTKKERNLNEEFE